MLRDVLGNPGGIEDEHKSFKQWKVMCKLIERSLNKEYFDDSKKSLDFILGLINDAYSEGFIYNFEHLKNDILVLAVNCGNYDSIKSIHWKSNNY